MHACDAAAGAKLGLNGPFAPTTRTFFLKLSSILLFSVMTLNYHRPYQISSLEAEV